MRTSIKYTGLLLILMGITSCVELKENQMYIEVAKDDGPEPFHASADIFSDYMTSEMWYTKEGGCVQITTETEASKEGDAGLHIVWDKITNGCFWTGMGFGWDNWSGKDISDIRYNGAVEFYVRMKEGQRTTLPWAIGIEDHAGAQAWLGMSSNAVNADVIGTEWTQVQLPLSEFDWIQQGADPSNIKQLIIEFHADGEVYLDEIRLVPYDGGYRKRATLDILTEAMVSNWRHSLETTEAIGFAGHEIYLGASDGFIFMSGNISDETPLVNYNEGGEVYNGDCIEIAFSTDGVSATRRTMLRSTDSHFGIRMNESPIVYDFWRKEEVEGAEVTVREISGGYHFDAKIPVGRLTSEAMKENLLFGLEVAVDRGDGQVRLVQDRWNNPGSPGFHENPTLWGEMIVKHASHENE